MNIKFRSSQQNLLVSNLTVSANNNNKRIGILIVAYNAVSTLAKVLNRIPEDVWNNVDEVVIFDDASQDHTYELGLGYKQRAKVHNLKIFQNPQNLGYGGNQKLGYKYFIEKGFDVVVLLHGDGQYAPEILSHLYHPLVTDKADAVFGSRMMTQYGGAIKGGMPLYKYIGNKILTKFENWSLNMSLTEFHSGYRAYSIAALRQLDFSAMTNDFHFDTEIIIKLNHHHFRIHEVPIPTYYGTEICYVNGLKYAKDVFRSVVRYKQTVRSIKKHPEYQEFFVKYPLKQSKYSSHYLFSRLVGSGHRVLDIGCGDGFLAATLSHQNQVSGIDILDAPKNIDAFQYYIQADLQKGLSEAWNRLGYSSNKIQSILPEEKFDTVLLPDILEHLYHPERLLQDCQKVLDHHGRLIVSVPNVANITVRLSLLFGSWNYTERGILDRTHYRFYTRKTIRKLLEENGYQVVKEIMTVMPIELAFGLHAQNRLMILLNRILAFFTYFFPRLLGYQCVIVALCDCKKE